MAKKVVIAGAGPVGQAVLAGFMEMVLDIPGGVSEIIVIDRVPAMGASDAFGQDTKNRAHLICNMHCASMSLNGERTDFTQWLVKRGYLRKGVLAHEYYASRAHYGEYTQHSGQKSKKVLGKRGVKVLEIEATVTKVTRQPTGGAIVTTDNGTFKADFLVLATGGMPSSKFDDIEASPRVFAHAYPFGQLKGIPIGDVVLVVGSSLTFIDVLATLKANGHQGHVYVTSSTGNMPSIRPKHDPDHKLEFATAHQLKAWTKIWDRPLTIDVIISQLERDLLAAGVPQEDVNFLDGVSFKKPLPIAVQLRNQLDKINSFNAAFTVLRAFSDEVPDIWRMLGEDQRRAFSGRFMSALGAAAFPCPPQNGEKLVRWFEEGFVQMIGTIDRDVDMDQSLQVRPDGIKVTYADGTSHVVDRVINATGLSYNTEASSATPLYQQMVCDGVLEAHPFGGVRVNFDTGEAQQEDGTPIKGIYVVGPMTKGVHWYTNSVDRNARSARRAVRHIYFGQKTGLRQSTILADAA